MSFLVLDGISKKFGDFTALSQVDLSVERGTVRAVLGENGAGKTTLMNVLYGLYRPTEGSICIDGKAVHLRSPSDAIANGIGMIHQHVHLAEALTVAENILLGTDRSASLIGLRRHARDIARMSESYGLAIDPAQEVWRLSMGMRQRVEILKVLYRGANILVLDEPTSVLAPNEVDAFLQRMRVLRDSGKTILFVTHKLDEVMALADDVTVMRQGRVVAGRRVAETDPRELSRLMVGRDVAAPTVARRGEAGAVVLECRDLTVRNDRGAIALDNLSIAVRRGEILGLAGVDGNGQQELAEAICGLRPLEAGRILAGGRDVTGLTADLRHRIARIGFVPEDRHGTGLVLDHSIALNFALRSFRRPPFARLGLLDHGRIARNAADLMERYDVRARSIRQAARDLSGGNQQKIILAREIEARPDILVVAQATKGLDIGAVAFVHRKLIDERDRGTAILYISTELEHVAEVADRIAMIFRGRITGELLPGELTAERAGLLMSGATGTSTGEAA
ncbi:ABC transporter ATP-binding protein [Pseudochelatococcus sp. B33]